MKNILFVCDTFLEGGMETRIAEASYEYKKHHINSFLAGDTIRNTNYCKNFSKISGNFHFIPQNGKLIAKDILEDSEKLIAFCKNNKIDFIEAQPFWSALPASIAAEECKISISYTLHGTESGNFINHQFFEASILYYLTLSFGIDQIIAVSERLANIYSYFSTSIAITRNSAPINDIPKRKFTKNGEFAIASRLDIPKTKIIIDFLPKLYNMKEAKSIDIYGDGDSISLLNDFISKNHYEDKINVLGWVENLREHFINKRYDCVFGVGRVATDAICTKTPIGIVSFGGFAGLINKDNLLDFAKMNFLSWDSSKNNTLEKEISALYHNPNNYLFNKNDLQLFDAPNNWKQHLILEQNLSHKDKPVIENIKNLLTSNPNEELFLGSNITNSLISLLNQYGKDKLIYTELLVRISDILSNNLSSTQQELSSLKSSASWKITKPLRKANRVIHDIKKS